MEVRPRQNAFFDRGLTATNYGCPQGDGINRDPLGETGGINLYGFVANSPMNAVDPNGEWVFVLGLGILADWAYDKYVSPHVEEYVQENFDCPTQERIAMAGQAIDIARALKNPVKAFKNL